MMAMMIIPMIFFYDFFSEKLLKRTSQPTEAPASNLIGGTMLLIVSLPLCAIVVSDLMALNKYIQTLKTNLGFN